MPRKDAFRRAIESYLGEIELMRSGSTLRTYRGALWRLYRDARTAKVTTYVSRWTLGDSWPSSKRYGRAEESSTRPS